MEAIGAAGNYLLFFIFLNSLPLGFLLRQTDHNHNFFMDFSVAGKKLAQWENAKRQANCKDHL